MCSTSEGKGELLNAGRLTAPFRPPTGLDREIEDARFAMAKAKKRGNWKGYRDRKKQYDRLLGEKRRSERKK
jgi:hypothetical protein